ncbi:MAG: glutaminase A, partial [Verrucomicrobia bacterium]
MPQRDSLSPIQQYLQHLHDKYARLEDGAVATYIPELGRANPHAFGIAIATVDGQVYEVGDSNVPFTIQSISKPLVYGLALETHGERHVAARVGVEPSGEAFNSISLDPATGRPLNPMINAGAIATSSLVPGRSAAERRAHLLDTLAAFAGHELDFDDRVYVSERDTGHRNRAIAHLLRNFGVLEGNPEEPLDLYFRQCSVLVTARDLAMMAATLANGGTNPITGRRVLQPHNTGRVLSVMTSCGMYDYAGEWMHKVGMPAKSGVAGGILAVLPGQLGVGVFSPPLDAKGNSVRGVRACTDLSRDFGLHLFNTPRVVTPALKSIHSGAEVRGRRLRRRHELELLHRHGDAIRVYQLRGRLVFASLEPVVRSVLSQSHSTTHVVLDLSRVVDVDPASCRLLLDLAEHLRRADIRIHLTGANDKSTLREYVEVRLSPDGWNRLAEPGHLADALESCEADLLRRHAPADIGDGSVELAEHELCRSLSPGELQDLAARLEKVDYPAGIAIVEAGAPSDSMYFIERGEVGIFLGPDGPGALLLSTLGPGMSFGEVALVDRDPRSATVRTLVPVRVLRLSFAEFDRLEESGLGHLRSKLVANLASVLAA